jgi:FkbM family methyltransferase
MMYLNAIRGFFQLARSHPVGKRQPIRTMGRMLAWQCRSRFFPGPHEQQWIENSRLVVERGMSGATGNLYFGLHEFPDMAFLLHFLRPDDLFLDVGANVGTYSVLAGRVCNARVWSFEPDPSTAINLARNLDANGITHSTTIHKFALGAAEGEIGFTTGLGAMNKVTSSPSEIGQSVHIRRLDDVMEGQVPVMIKVDVEGHEDAVFAGANTLLSDAGLLAIEAETVSVESDALLRGHGFKRRFYDPILRTLSADPTEFAANNQLYLRDPEAAQARVQKARTFNVFGWMI